MFAAVYRQRHLVKATEVTAGLAESNGSLLLGLWRDSLHVTCGLTACTPGSAPGPTLGNGYGKTLPLSFLADKSSQVEVVREFTYLGACTTHDGSSESEILRRIRIAKNCMTLLEKHTWKLHTQVEKKVRMHSVYVLMVLMYGSEIWSITKSLAR